MRQLLHACLLFLVMESAASSHAAAPLNRVLPVAVPARLPCPPLPSQADENLEAALDAFFLSGTRAQQRLGPVKAQARGRDRRRQLRSDSVDAPGKRAAARVPAASHACVMQQRNTDGQLVPPAGQVTAGRAQGGGRGTTGDGGAGGRPAASAGGAQAGQAQPAQHSVGNQGRAAR